MAAASDYRVDGQPRVRVLCAVTGELIYEPSHPLARTSAVSSAEEMDLDQQGGFSADGTDYVPPAF